MPIHIDGSYGEGGGSIVRLATAFSILLNKPIIIDNFAIKDLYLVLNGV